MSFAESLKKLRLKSGKSRYRLAQYSGLDQAYIQRLETGERANPGRDVVMMLALALVESSDAVEVYDVDELLLSAGYAPFRRRGVRATPDALAS
jgi:transcriptional regulator with XRE-family HTH domain